MNLIKSTGTFSFFTILSRLLGYVRDILIAVFLPLIFIEGISGTLFKETAIALSFSIIISSFVALTLSPMLASKFLTKKNEKNIILKKFEYLF